MEYDVVRFSITPVVIPLRIGNFRLKQLGSSLIIQSGKLVYRGSIGAASWGRRIRIGARRHEKRRCPGTNTRSKSDANSATTECEKCAHLELIICHLHRRKIFKNIFHKSMPILKYMSIAGCHRLEKCSQSNILRVQMDRHLETDHIARVMILGSRVHEWTTHGVYVCMQLYNCICVWIQPIEIIPHI